MAKKQRKRPQQVELVAKPQCEHGRGEIQDNAMAALVTSKLFKAKTETPKKGKGSFKRNKFRYKGSEPYAMLINLVNIA
ncbi:alternative ribosome rescue factor ArfA [Thaumasiovibrio subtropicus]|uniref:alternative ribosome rescue factor ArfA n=1 Tax=Thaumasiovibrio subtropicus TaxID=1891207 RepID=UPI000B355785|nr:alternative ribosome rescue factor ArfA [Thaumasiovibrio subtropicus]